ncbi:MAG: NAD(P)-dependent oxidoreductase, partial [Methanobacteriota archaeon]
MRTRTWRRSSARSGTCSPPWRSRRRRRRASISCPTRSTGAASASSGSGRRWASSKASGPSRRSSTAFNRSRSPRRPWKPSDMETLLVVGGSGLVGAKVAGLASKAFHVVATYRETKPKVAGVDFVPLHKERVEDAMALVRKTKPASVVDTAAMHNVDRCEDERELAWQVNAGSTGAIARAATDIGARYLFVSTDFVFDGQRGQYREEDVARPVNYYGETKLAGEHAALAASANNLVVRPSVIYGWDDTRLNFATWVLTNAREGKSINVVTDWIGSPTLADGLAASILRLLELPDGGVYHLAGAEAMSRH